MFSFLRAKKKKDGYPGIDYLLDNKRVYESVFSDLVFSTQKTEEREKLESQVVWQMWWQGTAYMPPYCEDLYRKLSKEPAFGVCACFNHKR